jgi:hypothetical protein
MSVEKDKVDLYVSKEAIRLANLQLSYGNCNKHDWQKHGHGYQCKECKRYTGDDQTLNKLIQKLLSKTKKK